MRNDNLQRIDVAVQPETAAALKRLAAARKLSLNQLVRRTLERFAHRTSRANTPQR